MTRQRGQRGAPVRASRRACRHVQLSRVEALAAGRRDGQEASVSQLGLWRRGVELARPPAFAPNELDRQRRRHCTHSIVASSTSMDDIAAYGGRLGWLLGSGRGGCMRAGCLDHLARRRWLVVQRGGFKLRRARAASGTRGRQSSRRGQVHLTVRERPGRVLCRRAGSLWEREHLSAVWGKGTVQRVQAGRGARGTGTEDVDPREGGRRDETQRGSEGGRA